MAYLLFFGLARLADARERHDVTVGTRLTFEVKRFDTGGYEEVKATCMKRGKHCYLFVDERYQVADELLTMAMIQWDYTIYPTVRTNFGIEWSPGVDGDYLIYILLTDLTDVIDVHAVVERTTGYYSIYDEMTETELGFFNQEHGTGYKTNEREIIYMDIDPLQVGSDEFNALLARLFQRMVHYYQSTFGFDNPRMEHEWVIEGCSLLAQFLCGYGIPDEYEAFLDNPAVELPETVNTVTDARAGGAFLLFLYLWEQFDGEAITRNLTSAVSTGIAGIGEALAPRRDVINRVYEETSELNDFDLEIIRKAFRDGYNALDQFEKVFLSTLLFKSIYMDWLCALILDDPAVGAGRYGFTSFDLGEIEVPDYATYPRDINDQQIESYAGRFYCFKGNADNTFRMRMISETNPEWLRVRLVKRGTLASSEVKTVNIENGWATARVEGFGETYPELYWVVGKVSGEETSAYDLRAYQSGPVVAAFLSPIYKNMIIIDVKASNIPVVAVYQDGAPHATDVDMTESPQGTYTGHYVLDPRWPGRGEISVRGIGTDFVHDEIVIPFEYQKETSSTMQLGSVAGVKLNLSGTVAGDGSVVLMVTDNADSGELRPLSPVAHVLVRQVQFSTPGSLSFPASGKSGLQGIGLFRLGENGRWVFDKAVAGYDADGRLRVPVEKAGRYAILYDQSRPQLAQLHSAGLDDGSLLVAGQAVDSGCGVDVDSLSIWDGQQRVDTELSVWEGDRFETVVDVPPAAGGLLRVRVSDRLGNAASSYVEVRQGAQPLADVSMKAFPCPAADGVTVRLTVNGGLGAASAVSMTVRNIAGELVLTADQADFANQGGGVYEFGWDLTTERVANGVYFYEVSVEDAGENWQGRGKIVVLK